MSRGVGTVRDPQWDADFALDDAAESDEDLPLPQQTDDPWMRRVGRPAGYLAVAVLAAGLLVRATSDGVTSGPDTTDQAAFAESAPPGEVVTGTSTFRRDGGSLISDDTACPAGIACRTSAAVPAPLAAAVRTAFPGAAITSVRTLSTTDGSPTLVGRFVHATTPGFDITVQIGSTPLDASRRLVGSGVGALAVVERTDGVLGVRVTVAGAGAAVSRGAAPVRLAFDRRLVTLG